MDFPRFWSMTRSRTSRSSMPFWRNFTLFPQAYADRSEAKYEGWTDLHWLVSDFSAAQSLACRLAGRRLGWPETTFTLQRESSDPIAKFGGIGLFRILEIGARLASGVDKFSG